MRRRVVGNEETKLGAGSGYVTTSLVVKDGAAAYLCVIFRTNIYRGRG